MSSNERAYRIIQNPSDEADAIVRIRVGKEAKDYTVHPVSHPTEDFIAAFEFVPLPSGGKKYVAALCRDGEATCTCDGHFYHNHCKHADLTPILFRKFANS